MVGVSIDWKAGRTRGKANKEGRTIAKDVGKWIFDWHTGKDSIMRTNSVSQAYQGRKEDKQDPKYWYLDLDYDFSHTDPKIGEALKKLQGKKPNLVVTDKVWKQAEAIEIIRLREKAHFKPDVIASRLDVPVTKVNAVLRKKGVRLR
jgi:hypothetical protein